jgi:protein-L-isoaspartate(D-aspartate) O-methyltransferase
MNETTEKSFDKQRADMVKYQIENRGVKNEKVLNAMLKIRRHLFVPENYKNYAYDDCPLSIGYNQTISQPYIVAYMTEKLDIQKTDKILEIGTGSGYQTAILAELSDNVHTIEIVPELFDKTQKLLNSLNYKNIKFKKGDGHNGWQEYAPYDKIILTAAPEKIPQILFEQLTEKGMLIAPVGTYSQELILYKKNNNKILKEFLCYVRFVLCKNQQ